MAIVDRVAGLSDDAYRYIMSLMSAARNAPASSPKNAPAMLRPSPTNVNPTTGAAIPVRDPTTGRMGPSPREFSPTQVGASRAAVAAPTVAAGAGGMSLLPQRLPDDTMGAEIPRGTAQEPGFEGAGARQMSGAALSAQPEPGYTGAGGDMMAPPMPPSRPGAVEIARLIAMQNAPESNLPTNPPLPPSRPQDMDKDSLWEAYNRSMQDDGGGSAAAFVRADRGRASGGSANGHSGGSSGGGRDAALHKALEIIQNLLMHRR